MDCDYCGPACPAEFEVSAGEYPGLGQTRYACAGHRSAAEGHVAQMGGPVIVLPTNTHATTTKTTSTPRSAA